MRDLPPGIPATTSTPGLDYAPSSRKQPNPLTQTQVRQLLLLQTALYLIFTLLWCFVLFATRQPALSYFFICAFLPLLFPILWLVHAWQLFTQSRDQPSPHRNRLLALSLAAFLFAPYCYFRAGYDMFTLSLRYHIHLAGGPANVRTAFTQWVATQPLYDPSNGRKLLFTQVTPTNSIVPIPPTQLPAEVRYLHDHFPSRFGMTWKDIARIDNVYIFTTTDICIGPPTYQPPGGLTLQHRLLGTRRKIADGIYLDFGTYNK